MKLARNAAPVAICFAAWEFVSRSGTVNAALFPPPSQVSVALLEMLGSGEMLRDIRASAFRLIAGLFCGAISAITLGLLTGRVKLAGELFTPLIQLLRPLPPVALIPLVIVWLGIGETAKVLSIGLAAFFPMWMGAHIGARQVPLRLLWSGQTLTQSKIRIFRSVVFPAALPFIAAGMRVGIAVAFVMIFVSELAGASEGVGYRIAASQLAYRIDRMIAALGVLGLLGALADYIFAVGMNRMFPWLKFLSAK